MNEYFNLRSLTDEAISNENLIAHRRTANGSTIACYGNKMGESVTWRFFKNGDPIDYSEAIRLLNA